MHSDVVHKFVFGLKRFPFSWAVFPIANVVALLGPADMLHGHMRDHLVHGAESSVTSFFGPVYLVLIYPLAGQLLFYGLPHVAEESSWPVVRGHVHPHVHVDGVIVVVERSGAVRIRARTRNRAIRIRPPE